MKSTERLVENLRYEATEVFFEEDAIGVRLIDGREVTVPLAFFPFLSQAKKEEREHYELFGRGGSIYFPKLDEYLSVGHLVLGFPNS